MRKVEIILHEPSRKGSKAYFVLRSCTSFWNFRKNRNSGFEIQKRKIIFYIQLAERRMRRERKDEMRFCG